MEDTGNVVETTAYNMMGRNETRWLRSNKSTFWLRRRDKSSLFPTPTNEQHFLTSKQKIEVIDLAAASARTKHACVPAVKTTGFYVPLVVVLFRSAP